MSTFWVSIEWQAERTHGGTDRQFESFLDEILDQLAKIGIEADYTATLSKRVVSFDWSVDAVDEIGALRKVLADMRSALHATGAVTAGWPRPDELVRREVRVLSARPDLIDA